MHAQTSLSNFCVVSLSFGFYIFTRCVFTGAIIWCCHLPREPRWRHWEGCSHCGWWVQEGRWRRWWTWWRWPSKLVHAYQQYTWHIIWTSSMTHLFLSSYSWYDESSPGTGPALAKTIVIVPTRWVLSPVVKVVDGSVWLRTLCDIYSVHMYELFL